jgi:hypothetical protein
LHWQRLLPSVWADSAVPADRGQPRLAAELPDDAVAQSMQRRFLIFRIRRQVNFAKSELLSF